VRFSLVFLLLFDLLYRSLHQRRRQILTYWREPPLGTAPKWLLVKDNLEPPPLLKLDINASSSALAEILVSLISLKLDADDPCALLAGPPPFWDVP